MSHHNQSDNCPGHEKKKAAASERRSSALRIVDGEITGQMTPPPQLWRSVEARDRDPALVKAAHREFPAGASELDGVSRRGFVQLLGASLAVTAAACTRPNQPIVPYVRRPPEVTPGRSLHFATACVFEGQGLGLVVESHEGRPTNIQGNPDHPDSIGATSAIDQALLLDLYDNDRARQITLGRKPVDWLGLQKAIKALGEKHAADGGARLRFLVEPNASPLLADLRARILARFPKAKFVAYASTASEGAYEGARLAFGKPVVARHSVAKASVVLSLDADFTEDGPEQLRLSRELADSRTPGDDMSRLYVVEPCLTPTGILADHRLRVRGSDVLAVAQAVASEIAKLPGGAPLAGAAGLPRTPGSFDARWIAAAAKDLAKARGKSLVIAGRRQPAAVHALVHQINAALGNVGATVSYFEPTVDAAGPAGIRDLAGEIAAGSVDTLVITAFNPAYTAPSDLKFGKLLERVEHSFYFTLHQDETAASVGSVIPAAHSLESWGDVRATDGTVSIVQPLIAPLWSGLTEADLLAAFIGEGDRGAYQLLRAFWQSKSGGGSAFEAKWEAWLAKGVVEGTAAKAVDVALADASGLAGAVAQATPKGGDLEIAFAVDNKVYDGRFANNAWLQELPNPVTKITWDNAVLISQTTAQSLGLETGDIVELALGDKAIKGPLYVQPGHADDTVTVALGYGRTSGGAVARGVGFNAGALRTSDAPWFVRGAGIKVVGHHYRFGITQDHWSMEGRDPAIVATLKELHEKNSEPNQAIEANREPLETIHEPVDYSKQPYKWGMTIDLNRCSGCGSCTVACQSENNIPVVGRDNVHISREMHWLRIDRYYIGGVEDPEVVTQPMLCQHCETAPCEYVCPVNATVHSDEGLNEMVYNRCIGTRYCSNNCPYKVRRFNFLDYQGDPPAVAKMGRNPDVTVRSRGVMEKCTFCVQRIERARIESRVEDRAIVDGEIQTACQQACASHAIVFGNLNDANSAVSRLYNDERRYNVLHELNTRPRVVYLARVRNPNPELA